MLMLICLSTVGAAIGVASDPLVVTVDYGVAGAPYVPFYRSCGWCPPGKPTSICGLRPMF